MLYLMVQVERFELPKPKCDIYSIVALARLAYTCSKIFHYCIFIENILYFLSTPCGGRTHTLSFKYRILSPARLPVPPREHKKQITIRLSTCFHNIYNNMFNSQCQVFFKSDHNLLSITRSRTLYSSHVNNLENDQVFH